MTSSSSAPHHTIRLTKAGYYTSISLLKLVQNLPYMRFTIMLFLNAGFWTPTVKTLDSGKHQEFPFECAQKQPCNSWSQILKTQGQRERDSPSAALCQTLHEQPFLLTPASHGRRSCVRLKQITKHYHCQVSNAQFPTLQLGHHALPAPDLMALPPNVC